MPALKLTPEKVRRAAGMIGRGSTQKAAAEAVGVSARQLRRAMASPEAREHARRARRTKHALAYDTAEQLLTHANANVRLQAAKLILATPEPDPDGPDPGSSAVRVEVVGTPFA